jgi:hypothetical protein
MIRVRERIAEERKAWLAEAERLLTLVIWASIVAALANLLLLLAARRRYARAAQADRGSAPDADADARPLPGASP